MILLVAVIAGLLAGVLRAWWNQEPWQPPLLHHTWVVFVAFLPQLFAFYLPATRNLISANLAAVSLVSSQIGLFVFCWLNRRSAGVPLLAAGLLMNLLVISANGGLMPMSLETAARFLPDDVLQKLQVGSRIGKDILLPTKTIVFPWLADYFVSPTWFQYRFAFSLGDILISIGTFWLLVSRPLSIKVKSERKNLHVNQPVE